MSSRARSAIRTRTIATTGMLLLVLPGCNGITAPEDLPGPLAATVDIGTEWILVDRPGFSFFLPPGFEKLPLTPIDSDAATYSRGSASFHHDYGRYSPRPDAPEGAADVRSAKTRIGGREVSMLSYRLDGTYVVKAFWAGLDQAGHDRIDLFVRADAENLGDLEELVATIHSVHFP